MKKRYRRMHSGRYTVAVRRLFATVLGLAMLLTACSGATDTDDGTERLQLSFENVLAQAESGNRDAQFELGAMYHDGDGVARDLGKAAEWYQKAAAAGNRQAQFNLGLMYKNGDGVKQDRTTARRLFSNAADAGDVRAMFQLGLMYYAGDGVQQDFAKALELFRKAAIGELADAQVSLAVMLIRAEGTPQNLVDAYAWLSIAKAGGSTRANEYFDKLAPKLTEDMRAQGKARIGELKTEMKKRLGTGN